jgi:hypothetical protein
MMNEPVIHQDFYTHAEIGVIAESLAEAYEKIEKEAPDFRVEDIKKLPPEIRELTGGVLYQKVQGD